MFRFFASLIFFIVFYLSEAAFAEVFSVEEQTLIKAFPTSSADLDLVELHSRALDEDANATDVYVAAIVALRMGANDLAQSHSQLLFETAYSLEDRTRAQLLGHFVEFYLGPETERGSASVRLIDGMSAYNAAGVQADWLMGTAATLLLDYAYNHGHPELSRDGVAEMSETLGDRQDAESGIWLVNSNLKAAYTASQHDSDTVDPFSFLFDGNRLVGHLVSKADDEDVIELLEMLYLRLHTTFGVIYSRRKSKKLSGPTESLPFIREFHPSFQIECVSEINRSKKRFRPRREFGTGGMMVELRVDNQGRVKFVETVDAQPGRLKEKFMHSYLRKWANSMRVSFKSDDPDCRNGGDLLLPFTLSWD